MNSVDSQQASPSRVLIVYRGQCDRVRADTVFQNYQLKIQRPLEKMGFTVDSILTYPDGQATIEDWITLWKPSRIVKIPIDKAKAQARTYHEVIKYISTMNTDIYKWIVIFRYDILYRTPISDWNISAWREGVVVPFREDTEETWKKKEYVSDITICISPKYIKEYLIVLEKALQNYESNFFHNSLHQHVKILKPSGIPLHFMFDGFYQSNTAKKPEGPLISAEDPRLSPFHILFSKPNYAGYSYKECFTV